MNLFFFFLPVCYENTAFAHLKFLLKTYRNVPKFLDRQVWANSADPDQTVPRGAV